MDCIADVIQLFVKEAPRALWQKGRRKVDHLILDVSTALNIESEVSKKVYMEMHDFLLSGLNYVPRTGRDGQRAVEIVCRNPLNFDTEIGLLALLAQESISAGQEYFGDSSKGETPEMSELARKLKGKPAPVTEQIPAQDRVR